MGDRSFLKAHNEPQPIGWLAEAPYQLGMGFEVDSDPIPILWMALFGKEHIKEVLVPSDSWEEDTPKVPIPAMHTPLEAARQYFQQRLPVIRPHVHPQLWPYVDLFLKAVENCGARFLEIDLYAFWALPREKDSAMLSEGLEKCISAFESAEAWTDFHGDMVIEDTSLLYGLPFLGSPFDGDIELPWTRVSTDGSLTPGRSDVRLTDDEVFWDANASAGDEAETRLDLDELLQDYLPRVSDPECIQRLVESGFDPNEHSICGFTPLMSAATRNPNSQIIDTLIAAGAQVNATDVSGVTALMFACEENNLDVINALIAAGADVNAADGKGRTVLMGVCAACRPIPIMRALIQAGA
ncbi:MAG: ankyrin repeat domain-containing protein [Candidatus Marinimicrobia bacterium]|nr:ankyrin repeat domain-containing protein [Candidatus Neomarinimicrobiota bacterium]